MRQASSLLPALALAIGLATSGCGSESTREPREVIGRAAAADTVGTLCAAGPNGKSFCVPATQDPAAAWKQATGGLPIQMWAAWPSNLTVEQFVSDAAQVKAWLANVDKVLAYVRDTQRNAESYKASMEGNLAALFKQAMAAQTKLLAQPVVDPIGKLKDALNAKGAAEKAPLVAELAADKQSIASVSAVLASARANLTPIQGEYATVVKQFAAYRATEAAETGAYTSLAQQASASTLDTISTVEQSVIAQARAASQLPNDLELSVMRLQGELQEFQISFGAALAPYTAFMATHGAPVPDMTSGALRSLNAMLGYIPARQSRSDGTANQLLAGIEVRRQALVTLATAAATRQTLAQTRLLAASSAFNDDASARIAALWKTPPTSVTLKLPYLSDRVDQFTTFLQLQPMCDPSSTSWRETGCIALRTNFNTAKNYLSSTIPMLIKLGVTRMQAKAVDPQLLAAVTAKLGAGDVKSAAVAYDAAVHASEVSQ